MMLKWKRSGETITVYLSGEIDHCAAEMLREKIEEAVRQSEAKILMFDFTDVTFMDSSGIGMLIGRYKSMAALGGRTMACGMNPAIRRLFTMAGLHRIISITQQEEGRKKA